MAGVDPASDMSADHRENTLVRRIVLIALAVVAVTLASSVYLIPRQLNRVIAPAPSHSPGSQLAPWNGPCAPAQLSLTGFFSECASVDKGLSCPTGSFDHARVEQLHGTKHDFLLYVEVIGAYHGSGTYALAPWPHPTLGVPDGVAKVAIREYATGRLWESTAGSVTIDNLEDGGYVYAGLGASTHSPLTWSSTSPDGGAVREMWRRGWDLNPG